jgi:hypothetical protein
MIGSSKSVWGFDPRTIPGCQLWLDGADSSTVTGTTTVTEWRDKSGNARHLGVGSGTTSYSSNAIVLNSSYMFVNSPVNLTNVTVFIVSKSTGVTNQTILGAKPNTDYVYNSVDGFGFYKDPPTGRIRFYGQGNDPNQSIFFTDTSITKLYTFQSTGTTVSGWLNGTSQSGGTLTTTRTSTAQGFAIGAEWGGSSYVNIWVTASIYEILVYNTALTASERQQVEGYLAHKWGLQTSIPSTHPFYSIRPHLRTFQPIDVPGCALWLDAADQGSFTLSGSSVIQWSDKSGNNRHATQSVSVNRPVYSSSDMSVDTTTNPRFFNMTNMPSAPYDIFVVGTPIATTSNWRTLFRTNTNEPGMNPILLEAGSKRVGYFTSTGFVPFGSYTWEPSTRNLLFARMNSTKTMNASLNGQLELTANTVAGTASDVILYMGALVVDGSVFQEWGTINEVIFYTTPLTTSQRQQVEGYLAHKWGLTPSLPVISPLSIPGCQLWLDGADQSSMTLSGSSITQLRDKSGNGNHMVSNGTSPLYNSSLINSVGGIDCTNGGALISSGIQNSANISFAMVAVVKSGIRNWGSFFTHGDRDYDFAVERQENTSSINFQTANDNSSCIITFTVDAPVLYFGTMTSGTTRFFESFSGGVNTIVNGTNPSTISLGSKIIRVGKSDNNNEPCNSFIGEIIYYNTVLTTIQRQQIEGYLARKWGISISATLPSPHSFKSFPPASLPFSPRNISGLQLWLDAADQSSLVLSGSSVTQWNDKSGRGFNATTPAGTNSPTYLPATRELQFVATNTNVLRIAQGFGDALVGTTYSIFFVGRRTTATGYHFFLGSTANGASRILLMTGFFDNNMQTNVYGPEFTSSIPTYTSPDPIRIYCFELQSSSLVTHIMNGTQVGSDTQNYTLTSFANPELGRRYGQTFHTFNLSEMIAFSPALTTPQRQQIEGYLAQKWGLTESLPSSHPFKKLPA